MQPSQHQIDLTVDTDEQGRTVLVARGDVDLQTAPTLRDRIANLSVPGETLVLDLRGVAFMDSPGLGTVVYCERLQRERGSRLVLRGPAGPVRELLDMVRIADVIEVED